tara:strand:- start:6 stop:1757 length:1752 start_codon:yes stop_codon:yes gene_type:complete
MNVSGLIKDAGNTYNKQLDKTRALVGKWDKTGLLEGIDHDYDKHGMAVLLENQARQLIDEASSGNRSTGAAGYEEWSGVALPLVRRIFAEIAAKDFVSVQPMNLPSGLVFWLDFKYGGSENALNAGFGLDDTTKTQAGTLHGTTDQAGDPTGGLYGAGSYGFSINNVTLDVGTVGENAATVAVATVPQLFSGSSLGATLFNDGAFNFDSDFSASYLSTQGAGGDTDIKIIRVLASDLTGLDKEGVRAFVPNTATAAEIRATFPQFTRLTNNTGGSPTGTNDCVQFVISGSLNGGDTALFVEYHKAPDAEDRGDFETTNAASQLNPETDLGIPEIDVQLRSEAIVAKTRKLKAVWTPEFAQDLNAYHSIDAEAELTSMLSEYVSMEIDLEILDMLFRNALTKDYWSAKIGETYNAGTSNFTAITAETGAAQAYNQGTWFQTLGTKIQKVSNAIHQKTMRGGANFLVCSPKVATILESIPGYAADTDGTKTDFAMGVQKVGALNSRYQVYKNPYMLENQILMGFRGGQFLETGAVYAPYVPLIMTPLVYDPKNFTPRKGVMTRYAKKIVRPEFYGTVAIKGLDTI